MPKYVYRNGRRFKVLKYSSINNEVQVEDEMDFYEAPYTRKVKCWWSINDCELSEVI